MKTGALILAAGMSSRMGAFKPLLPMGDDSMCMYVIDKFVQVQCNPIIIVTGQNADELEMRVWEEILESQETTTLKEILRKHNEKTTYVSVLDPYILEDCDTRVAYEKTLNCIGF